MIKTIRLRDGWYASVILGNRILGSGTSCETEAAAIDQLRCRVLDKLPAYLATHRTSVDRANAAIDQIHAVASHFGILL